MSGKRTKIALTAGIFCVALLAANFLMPQFDAARAFVAIFTLLYFGYEIGVRLIHDRPWPTSFALGAILALGAQSITQTAAYYLAPRLGFWSDALGLIAVVTLGTGVMLVMDDPIEKPALDWPKGWRKIFWTIAPFLTAAALTLVILIHAHAVATTATIRTPWLLLGWKTLVALAALWLALFVAMRFGRKENALAWQAGLTLAAVTFLAPLVYAIGFGFDGFLHTASEKILLTTGTLAPKPLYYIGQYVFTTWLSRTFDLPLPSVNRWLVPLGAALMLPLSLLLADKPRASNWRFSLFGLLPLAPFIATTPQALAYVLGFSALLLTWGASKKTIHPLAPLILCAWAVAAHPLAGLPLLFVCLAVLSAESAGRLTSWIFVALAGTIVPVSFLILGLRGGTEIAWHPETLLQITRWLNWLKDFLPWVGNHFVLWPAWSSLVVKSLPTIMLLLTIASLIVAPADRRRISLYLGSALAFWLGAAVLNISGDFSFLIDYERSSYADRLYILALFCLLPAAIPAWCVFWEKTKRLPLTIQLSALTLTVAISTGIAYAALPRHDALITGRGWSTSQSDIEAVSLIDRDATSTPYVVLADQSVSAAAVSALGFKRYASDVFFYPIPTGGPLYKIYLDMTYGTPSREQVRKAAELGQAQLVYVVINNYWWKAESLIEALKPLSDHVWTLGDGAVTVFRLNKISS